jgi:hypothetical protein
MAAIVAALAAGGYVDGGVKLYGATTTLPDNLYKVLCKFSSGRSPESSLFQVSRVDRCHRRRSISMSTNMGAPMPGDVCLMLQR